MAKPDGGAAFPALNYVVPADLEERHVHRLGETRGMSLRDFFAAQALSVAHGELARQMGEGELAGFGWDIAAELAYRIADAMLHAREQ